MSMRVIVLLGFVTFASAQVNFDNLQPGGLPPNWTRADSSAGSAKFLVRRDPTAPSRPNVFGQSASGPHQAGFPLLYDKVVCRDGDLSVKFKIGGMKPDQSAGLVFRYRDVQNYYLLNFSVDKKSISLVRVLNGVSSVIEPEGQRQPGALSYDLRSNQWYVAKIVFRGPRVRVLFGNRRLFEVQELRVPEAGKTGIWTRGETEASFDDFRIDRKS